MPQVPPQDIRSLDPFLQARVPQEQKPQIHWPDAEEALYTSDGTLHIEVNFFGSYSVSIFKSLNLRTTLRELGNIQEHGTNRLMTICKVIPLQL